MPITAPSSASTSAAPAPPATSTWSPSDKSRSFGPVALRRALHRFVLGRLRAPALARDAGQQVAGAARARLCSCGRRGRHAALRCRKVGAPKPETRELLHARQPEREATTRLPAETPCEPHHDPEHRRHRHAEPAWAVERLHRAPGRSAARRGLIAEHGISQTLPRLVGLSASPVSRGSYSVGFALSAYGHGPGAGIARMPADPTGSMDGSALPLPGLGQSPSRPASPQRLRRSTTRAHPRSSG